MLPQSSKVGTKTVFSSAKFRLFHSLLFPWFDAKPHSWSFKFLWQSSQIRAGRCPRASTSCTWQSWQHDDAGRCPCLSCDNGDCPPISSHHRRVSLATPNASGQSYPCCGNTRSMCHICNFWVFPTNVEVGMVGNDCCSFYLGVKSGLPYALPWPPCDTFGTNKFWSSEPLKGCIVLGKSKW